MAVMGRPGQEMDMRACKQWGEPTGSFCLGSSCHPSPFVKASSCSSLSWEQHVSSSSSGHAISFRNTGAGEQQRELTIVCLEGISMSGNLFQRLMNIVGKQAGAAGGSRVGAPWMN